MRQLRNATLGRHPETFLFNANQALI